MPAEDKYGQQLQAWFQENATTEPRSVQDAKNAIGCSRQRIYQWLHVGARDVVEVDRNTRGAALFIYRPGARRRLSVGPHAAPGLELLVLDGHEHRDGTSNGHQPATERSLFDAVPGTMLRVVSVTHSIDGGAVALEDVATGERYAVTVTT